MESQSVDEILNRCIDRMLGGEPLERILASHAGMAAELRPALESAAALLSTQAPAAPVAPRERAMQQMLAEVSKPRVSAGVGGVMGMFSSFSKYPVALRGAGLIAAMALVGAAGLGGAAAMGGGPEPVREFLGLSTSSINVEFEGVIVSVDGSNLVVAVGTDERSVTVAANAEISRGGDALALTDLAAGDLVEVKGTLQADNTILATRVHVEDGDDDASATPEPTLELPVIAPTDDHDDDDDVDDDGEDADDQGEDSDDRDCDETPAAGDNSDSGPGSCDDDEADDLDDDDGTETPEADDDADEHEDDGFEDSQHTPEIDDDEFDDDGEDDEDETRTPEPEDDDAEDGEDNSGPGN